MLLAEDVLLLVLDPESGRLRTSYGETVIGGALLAELALTGAVEVGERTSRWRSRKVQVVGPPPVDPVLAGALDRVRQKPRAARELVSRLGKKQLPVLRGRLEQQGHLRLERSRVLGLFPRRRWPAASRVRRDALVREVVEALVTPGTPQDRSRALVALLACAGRVDKLVEVPGLSRREVAGRVKELSQGEWAATAVRDAITASQTVMMTTGMGGAAAVNS